MPLLAGFFDVLVAGGTVIVDAQDWRVVHGRGITATTTRR